MRPVLIHVFRYIAILSVVALPIAGQSDPDPDSPVPVLVSAENRNRVLAVQESSLRYRPIRQQESIFFPGRSTAFTLYVSNIELMPSEGANAFRVYIRQKSGRIYELETRSVAKVAPKEYALGVALYDPAGYRGQPAADGDSLIYVTWRGLASNSLKIGIGSTGGDIPRPEPLPTPAVSRGTTAEYVGYRWSGDRKRFLEQAAFGPNTELDNRIRRIGLRTWLAEQFEAPYPTMPMPEIPQKALNPPADCRLTSNPTCYRQIYTMMPLQQWFFREAMYGDAQLRHRTAWALSQIWVTSGITIQQSSHQIAFHKVLMDNAFGNYRDLMQDATLSPTMGVYLDMVRSTKNNPNENYPREILQLFTIGLNLLNQDGTPQGDGQGATIPTYDQELVNNLSKVMTGWTYCNTTCANSEPGILNYKDPMILVPANHDLTEKTLLNYPGAPNVTIPACTNCTTPEAITTYANESLKKALDNIFYHPNVGPFIGKLLIQHFVTSDPSPAYVLRVAGAFNDNGSGIRGDMKAVIRTILLDPEARGSFKTAPRYGKLREPVQLVTNLARLFPARDFSGEYLSDGALSNYVKKLGQDPFYSPTVFNYFAPDYVVPGSTILAPEFELLNTGTAINRTNLLYTLIFEGFTPNAADSLRGTRLDLSEMVPFASADPTGGQLMDALNQKMMHATMSAEHREKILAAVLAVPASDALLRVKTAVYLIAASSQYQVQR